MANLGSKPQALLSWDSPPIPHHTFPQVLQMELAGSVWFSIIISLQSHKSFYGLVLFHVGLPASFAVLRWLLETCACSAAILLLSHMPTWIPKIPGLLALGVP